MNRDLKKTKKEFTGSIFSINQKESSGEKIYDMFYSKKNIL